MLTTVKVLDRNDPRARITIEGDNYRVKAITNASELGYGVDLIQLTKAGADRKRGNCAMWLSVEYSLSRFSLYAELHAYIMELIAELKDGS